MTNNPVWWRINEIFFFCFLFFVFFVSGQNVTTRKWQGVDVCLQTVPGRVQILGHASQDWTLHSWYRSVFTTFVSVSPWSILFKRVKPPVPSICNYSTWFLPIFELKCCTCRPFWRISHSIPKKCSIWPW